MLRRRASLEAAGRTVSNREGPRLPEAEALSVPPWKNLCPRKRGPSQPVLIANAEPGPRWQQVFIATDLSKTSAHAARTAQDLGLLDGAEATFVNAYAPVRQMMIDAGLSPLHVIAADETHFQDQRRAVD